MAKKKKTAKKNRAPEKPAAPAAPAMPEQHEVFCSRCAGMVNGNGCAKSDCPVAI